MLLEVYTTYREFTHDTDSQLPGRADRKYYKNLDRNKSLLPLVFNSHLKSSPSRQIHSLGKLQVLFLTSFLPQ